MYPLKVYDLIAYNKLKDAKIEIDVLPEIPEKIILLAHIEYLNGNYNKSLKLLDEVQNQDDYRVMIARIVVNLYNLFRLREFDIIEDLRIVGDKIASKLVYQLDRETDEDWKESTKIWIGYYYNIIAVVYLNKGLFKPHTIDYYNMSFKYRKSLKNKLYAGMSLNNLGILFLYKGEYIVAKSYFSQALEISKNNEKSLLNHVAIVNLGITYYYSGDPIKALEYFLSNLDCEYSAIRLSTVYLYTALCYLDTSDLDEANLYVEELQLLKKENSNLKEISLHADMAYAMYLKSNERYLMRAQAQLLLGKIIDDKIIDVSLTKLAMINLADLLIEEYKLFGDETPYNELHLIVSTLYQIAQDQESIDLMIEVLIFQARVSLIKNLKYESLKLLRRAEGIAEVNSMNRLIDKIKTIEKEIEKGLYETDKGDKARILNYLEDLSNLIKG